MNNCFSIYHTSWITSGPKSNFFCENIATNAIFFFSGCSEVNSTWLITSERANQRARKALFTCVVYTNPNYETEVGGTVLFCLWSRSNLISSSNEDVCTALIQSSSALVNSGAVRILVPLQDFDLVRAVFFSLFTNLTTRAVTRSNFLRSLNRVMSIKLSTFGVVGSFTVLSTEECVILTAF